MARQSKQTIEMQHPDRPSIHFFQRPKSRQRKTVVSSEGNQLRLLEELRSRASFPQLSERLCHLPQRHGVVHRRDGNIAAVDDFGPVLVGVDPGPWVKAPEGCLAA